MVGYIINILGLIFDITGVLMLFKYGLPKLQHNVLLSDNTTVEQQKKEKRYDKLSKIALGLIFAGFLFQLSSNIIFMIAKGNYFAFVSQPN